MLEPERREAETKRECLAPVWRSRAEDYPSRPGRARRLPRRSARFDETLTRVGRPNSTDRNQIGRGHGNMTVGAE